MANVMSVTHRSESGTSRPNVSAVENHFLNRRTYPSVNHQLPAKSCLYSEWRREVGYESWVLRELQSQRAGDHSNANGALMPKDEQEPPNAKKGQRWFRPNQSGPGWHPRS